MVLNRGYLMAKKVTEKQWIELLKKTTNKNNWLLCHKRFQENSLLRELIDVVDYYYLNENNPPHDEVYKSIHRNPNTFYSIRQASAILFMKAGSPNKRDLFLFLEMFIRQQKLSIYKSNPLEADWDLLDILVDVFKKYNATDNKVNTFEQAFGTKLTVGKKNNPFEVPDFVVTILFEQKHSIVNGSTEWGAIKNYKKNLSARAPDYDHKYYERELKKYKFSALNDYLHEQVGKRMTSSTREFINSYWDIKLPNELKIEPTFMKYGLGKLGGKGGKKTVTAEVIKAKDLH